MIKKIFCSVLAVLAIVTLFSSCKEEEQNFLYPIEGNVFTLDPQSASTSDELSIIANTIEGLVRKDKDGNIKGGVATSWNISSDGKVYTFKLAENIKWDLNKNITTMMGDENWNPSITAHDFVFGLRRACDSATKAPFFNSIAVIENATEVHNGEMPLSALGVKAINDYELEIRLEKPDDDFLETLTSAIAMPCNEEFFNATKGRYGLEKDYTLFNGPYYLSRWYQTSFIMRRSEIYKRNDVSRPVKLTFNVTENDRASIMKNLFKGVYDAAIITGEESEQITEKDGIKLTPYENTVWAYVFNTTDESMANENIRKAICSSLSINYETNKKYLSKPQGIVPTSCNVNKTPYRDYAGEANMIKYDEQAALNYWLNGLKEVSPSEMEIVVLCPESMQSYVREHLQGVQKVIGRRTNYKNKYNKDAGLDLSIKVEAVDDATFETRIRENSYQIALYPIKATDDSALKFLKELANEKNITSFKNDTYNANILKAENEIDSSSCAKLLKQCEQILIDGAYIHPAFAQSNYFATAKGVSGVNFYTTGSTVNFVYAERKD